MDVPRVTNYDYDPPAKRHLARVCEKPCWTARQNVSRRINSSIESSRPKTCQQKVNNCYRPCRSRLNSDRFLFARSDSLRKSIDYPKLFDRNSMNPATMERTKLDVILELVRSGKANIAAKANDRSLAGKVDCHAIKKGKEKVSSRVIAGFPQDLNAG